MAADRSNWWLVGLGILGLAGSLGGTALALGGRDQRLADVEKLQSEDHKTLEQVQLGLAADIAEIKERLKRIEGNQGRGGR